MNELEKIQPLLEKLHTEIGTYNPAVTWAVNSIQGPEGVEHANSLYTYIRPEYAVAQAIAKGESPSQALQQWRIDINTMLADFRRKRRESVLIESHSAAEHLGKKLPATPTQNNEAGISTLHLALATLAVYQANDLERLLDELVASTIPLDGWDTHPQIDLTALSQWLLKEQHTTQRLTEERNTATAKASELQQALEQAQQQQHTLTQQLSAEQHTIQRLTEERNTATAKASELEQELQHAQQQAQALQEENDLIIEQLHTVQEAQERTVNKTQEWELAVHNAKQALEQAQQQQHTLTQQLRTEQHTTQRLTEERNSATAKATQLEQELQHVQQQAQALQQENDLIIEQLHTVQEELERVLLKSQVHEAAAEHAKAKQPKQRIKAFLNNANILQRYKAKKKLKRDLALIKQSKLFDAAWYTQTYPDIAKAGHDPATHYLRHGAGEGRDPGPGFSTLGYLREYPDVAASPINPLVHYIRFGQHESRSPNPY